MVAGRRRYARTIAAIAGGVTLACLRNALAADAPPPPVRDFNTYQPTARATRIESAEAPVIDGDLSDPAWARAEVIDEFYQIGPDPGQPATERTMLRFLYDANNLYVSIYAYDSEPHKIVATNQTRDGNLGVDDVLRLYLDPLNTRRNSYDFEVNALGARIDALLRNNQDRLKEWNTIWTARARIASDGYTVEIAIPFRDLSYDPTKPDWVIDLSRVIRRTGERIRWSSINPAISNFDISQAGTLTGISDINQGIGLDIQLYGSLRYRFDWQDPKRENESFRASGNAFYKFTPQLVGTLTVNPDFSDAPLDIRQVNTTRFVLFQPETRNFFLQDVATFQFGGHGFATGDTYNYPGDNGTPFFSRNIGLANNLPVSIMSGAKLSGEYAGLEIGALSVLTNGTGDTQHSQALSVARITKPIGESKLGIMLTNGDPTGRTKNTVAAADFQFQDSSWTPGKILRSDFYYERSFSDTEGDDDALGIAILYPNERWGGEAHFKQVGENFTPALGFVNRTGIRQYDGLAQYRNRSLGWRWFDVASTWYFVTGLDNRLQSRENGIWTGISTKFEDQYYFRVFNDFENVPANFKLAGKVPVPAGRYTWTNIDPYITSSEGRPYVATFDVLCCSFYNGDYLRANLKLDLRPNPYFDIVPRYTYTYISLPTGLVNIHLLAVDLFINFTPDMQLFTQLQFDNISQNFTGSIRYRWEYEPGQEVFASVGQSAVIPGEPTFVPQSTQATFRLGHTFRF
jgi:hypothetical protein